MEEDVEFDDHVFLAGILGFDRIHVGGGIVAIFGIGTEAGGSAGRRLGEFDILLWGERTALHIDVGCAHTSLDELIEKSSLSSAVRALNEYTAIAHQWGALLDAKADGLVVGSLIRGCGRRDSRWSGSWGGRRGRSRRASDQESFNCPHQKEPQHKSSDHGDESDSQGEIPDLIVVHVEVVLQQA